MRFCGDPESPSPAGLAVLHMYWLGLASDFLGLHVHLGPHNWFVLILEGLPGLFSFCKLVWAWAYDFPWQEKTLLSTNLPSSILKSLSLSITCSISSFIHILFKPGFPLHSFKYFRRLREPSACMSSLFF